MQLKESRDSIGKRSTLVHAGQKIDFDRVQKTIRRSKNRIPKSAAEEKRPKLSRAKRAAPTRNQPSRVECRTPSPEPFANKELDKLDGLDPNCSRSGDNTRCNDISDFVPMSDTFTPFSSLSDDLSFESFDASRFKDPFVEIIWDCYARTLQKLALKCDWLRTDSVSDPVLDHFRSDNALLAILEPLIPTNGHGIMRESFLANFLSSFKHRPELSEFRLVIHQIIERGSMGIKTISQHATVIDSALQYLGLQPYTCRWIRTREDTDLTEFPASTEEQSPALKTEGSNGLSPNIEFTCPGTQIPPTPLSFKDCEKCPSTNEFETTALAFYLGELETAETRLRAFTSSEGSVSTNGQVLMRLAWYCLSRVQRETGKVEEADGSLMRSVYGSIFYPVAGTKWDEVSYLFI